MNVRLDNGSYCHEKCNQVKKCQLCNEVIVATEVKHARCIPNGIWLCKDCKMCKQCLKFFNREDLDVRRNLRRQGRYCWHAKCFKCIVSIIHKHNGTAI